MPSHKMDQDINCVAPTQRTLAPTMLDAVSGAFYVVFACARAADADKTAGLRLVAALNPLHEAF